MGTKKKGSLIASAIIGGLLLSATMKTGNSFALSDNPPVNTSQPTVISNSPAPQTNEAIVPVPPTSGAGAIATGSSASQTGSSTVEATSTATTSPSVNPPLDTPTQTDPTASSTNTTQADNTSDTNTVTSTAGSGNATVEDAATGGDATSGGSSATTELVNAIGSTTSFGGGAIQAFTYNVDGTQNGNIVIDPSAILPTTSAPVTPICLAPTSTTATQNNTTITNLVNLLARSGSATVSNDGSGGEATSGNATTEANVINMIQDLVSNQGSFLGIININGNLNGNIVLPASVVGSLLTPSPASNANATANVTNNETINNNVSLTAVSGTASVVDNGSSSDATSGNATTILNTCNIINGQIVGGNLLLVFVNIMGNWYGALLSEPPGTTSATLGSSISQDTTLPTSQVTATSNETIDNNLHLLSISGNATVANDGTGGSATTGNATAIADIVNILGSQIDLSGWLGVLIINVFGTWNGSLTVQPLTTTTTSTSDARSDPPQPTVDASTHSTVNVDDPDSPPQDFDPGQYNLSSAHILGATTVLPGGNHGLLAETNPTSHLEQPKRALIDFVLAGFGAVLVVVGILSRFYANRRQKTL